MTVFLAHYANNLSHFSHEAEFFTVSSSAEDDEFYIFAHDESDMVKTTSVVCGKQRSFFELNSNNSLFIPLVPDFDGCICFACQGPYLSVFRRVLASGKPMQDQMAKLGKTLESLRQSYGVSSPAAKNIEDFLARLEKLMERESRRELLRLLRKVLLRKLLLSRNWLRLSRRPKRVSCLLLSRRRTSS